MMTVSRQPHLLAPLTPEDLGKLQLQLPTLKLLSFKGPGESGGVATSLAPLTRQLGTKVQWIALSGMPSETERAISGFSFHRLELTADLISEYSQSVQDYLWPLFHGLTQYARFDAENWKNFRQLSLRLAHQSQKVAGGSFPTLIWLHDFEMVLLAPMLSMEAGIILAHFWHIPWPEPEVIKASPVGLEITESLLSNRLVGFHTSEYASNFVRTVGELVPDAKIDFEFDAVSIFYRGNTTRVVAMPLGLDYSYWQRLARASRGQADAIQVSHRLAPQIVLGVDRLDYTKGLLERLDGLDLFLASNPDYHRRLHYVQLAQPSSGSSLESYAQHVRTRAGEINKRYGTKGWEPVVWMEGYFDQQKLAAWYQASDVLAVTPLRDGLNLIAKEYIACRMDEQGTVVLSKKAGCAAELLSGALLVEPEDPESIASGIEQALSMAVEEKRRRMVSMRHVVAWNRLHDWACGFLRYAISPPETGA